MHLFSCFALWNGRGIWDPKVLDCEEDFLPLDFKPRLSSGSSCLTEVKVFSDLHLLELALMVCKVLFSRPGWPISALGFSVRMILTYSNPTLLGRFITESCLISSSLQSFVSHKAYGVLKNDTSSIGGYLSLSACFWCSVGVNFNFISKFWNFSMSSWYCYTESNLST